MIHRVGTIRSNLHLEHSVCARSADSFDRNADAQSNPQPAPVIDGEIDEVANPLWRKFHENALLALSSTLVRSASTKRRQLLCAPKAPLPNAQEF
jgi:hypothetical protein